MTFDEHTTPGQTANGGTAYDLDELDGLLDAVGGSAAFEALALQATADALEGYELDVELSDHLGSWRLQATVSQVKAEDPYLHSTGPAALTTESPYGYRRFEVVAFELSVAARLRGTVAGLDPGTQTDGVKHWIIDAPVGLYVGGVVLLDPETHQVLGATAAIDERLSYFWDLTSTGVHELTAWATFLAYAPPWATSRGSTGSPPAVS